MALNTGVIPGYNFVNITADAPTTTVVKSGAGVFHTLVLNKPVATETISMYDGPASGGIVIGTITVPASPQPVTLHYDASFVTSLTIVTATAASDITVTYV